MRKVLKILLSLAVIISMTACNNSTNDDTGALQIHYIDIDGASMTQYVNDFRKSYPNEKIEYTDMNAYENGDRIGVDAINETKLVTELLSGKGPDLIICKSGAAPFEDLDKAVQSGAFEALDSYIEQDETFNYVDYYKPIFEAGKFDGKLYVMPYSFTMPLYISSNEHLTANNIAYQNWNDITDLTDAMSAFIQQGEEMHFIDAYSFLFRNNFYYNTTDIFDVKNSAVNINSEKCRQLLQSSKLLYQTEKPLDNSSIGMHTVENTILMPAVSMIDGLSQAVALDRMGHTPVLVPIKDSGKTQATLDIGMVINANSKNKQRAYDFIRIMMQPGDGYNELGSNSISRANFDNMVAKQNHDGEIDAIKNSADFLLQYGNAFDEIDSCVFKGGVYDEFSDLTLPYFNDEVALEPFVESAQSSLGIYLSE